MTTARNSLPGQERHAPLLPTAPVEVTAVNGASDRRTRRAHGHQAVLAFTLASDGAVLQVNSGATSPDVSAAGRLWECDCFPAHVRRRVRSAFMRAARGEAVCFVVPIRTGQSGETPGSVQIAPVAPDQERPGRLVAFVTTPAAPSEGGAADGGVEPDGDRTFLAHIVDSTDDAVVSKTLDGVITSWNRAAERIFGHSAEDAIGQHVSLIIPPDRLDEEQEILSRLRLGKRIDHYETERVTRDGRRIRVSLTISPMRDPQGHIFGACKIARDVTERRLHEATLARRVAHQTSLYNFTDRLQRVGSIRDVYAAALDAITEALGCERASILLLDDDGVMRFVQARGLSEEYQRAVEGHSPWAIDHKNPQPVCIGDVSRAELASDVRSALNAEGIGSLAFVPLTRDGRLIGKFMVYYREAHEFIADEVELSVLIARQLTFNIDRLNADARRAQAERAMRQSEERFTRFMAHLPGLAWIKNSQGRYVYANQAALEAFGVSAQSLYGKTDAEIFPRETAAAFTRHDRQALKGDSGMQVVETLTHLDKQVHHSLVHKFRIPGIDPGSDLIGGMAIDITAMKKAEDALRVREGQYRDLSSRLTLLLRSTSRLIETLKIDEMLCSVLSLSRELIAADAFGLWRLDDEQHQWRLVASDGLSDEFANGALPRGVREQIPREPVVVQPDDLLNEATPMLKDRWGSYQREGIRSLMIIPLRIRGEISGTLVFYCRRPHVFSEIEVESASAMANITAAALTTSELYDAESRLRESAQAAARREAFLAAAGAALNESFDPEHSLGSVATAAVPRFADWCCVDLLNDHGRLERLVDVHVDPRHAVLARQMREKYPPDERAGAGVHHVMRTATPELLSALPESLLQRAAQSEEHLQWLRELRLQSQISLPLFSGGAVCGTITFVTSLSERRYDESDLAIAQEVARRASQALDNARLYRDLAESETQLRLAMEAGRMGSWEWRIDSNEVIWSASLEEIHGLEPGAFEQTFEAFERDVHPDDVERVRHTISRALETGELPSVEYRAILPDGSERWLEGRGRLFHDEVGNPVRMIGVCTDITARRQADEALRESERRFREMINALPAAVYTTDADGWITHFNPAAVEFAGRTPEIGQDRWCVTHRLYTADGTLLPHEKCPMAVALENGESIKGQDVIAERPDGTRRWFQPHPTPLRDKDGKVVGGINMLVDVTERRKAEQALRESEERYRRLVALMPVAVYTCEAPGGRITFYNEQAAKIWGRRPRTDDTDERFCGSFRLWRQDGTPLPHDQTPMAIALREGKTCRNCDVIVEQPDGTRVNVLVNIDPIRDADGRIIGAINAFQDVTQRYRIEQALRESEGRFRLMADAAPVLIWVSDENKRGIYFNDSWLKFTGRTHEQECGDGWLESIHPDDLEATARACQSAFDQQIPFRIEFRMRRADGEYRWLLDHGVPRFTEDGKLTGYIGSCIDVTDHKEAEEALRQSECRYRAVVEGQAELICRFDPEGEILFVNDAYARAMGHEMHVLQGADFWHFIHDEDRDLVRAMLGRLCPDAPEISIENRIGEGDKARWTLWRNRALSFDDHGRATEVQSSGIDITDRKRAEFALRDSEQRFRELANGIDQLVWTCNTLGQPTWYNQRWFDFTGTTLEEMRGEGWRRVHHPDHMERVIEGLNRAVEAGEPWEDLFPLRGRDGTYRWFLSRAVPIRDRSGQIVRWLGTNTDVTEQRQAEAALKAKELELELITSSTPLILCRCTSDLRYRFVNQAAASLFGLPPEQIVGRPIVDVMGEEAFRLIRPYIDRVVAGEQVEFELEIPYIAAGARWVRINYIPDRDQHGAVIGWIASIVDFTEQKRVEAALKQSHENLERRVAERTSELQRRADQLARLTSELTLTERRERERLAKILHDHLQQLLASGKLGLEFIARSNDEKRRSEWIDHARTCVDEAIEASRSLSVELCPPVLHEGGLAAGCEWLARRMKERHGLTVNVSVDASADPDREDVRTLVFESIRELLFNTTKHARVKEASLELAVHDEDYLRVVIEDQGAGFDAEKLLHAREHVGFGLFNIRERLAMLGGTFKIESQVGKGSRFTLIAPRHGRSSIRTPLSDPPDTRTGKVSKLSARRRSRAKDRIRVVVVDDHAVMRQGLCSLLAEEPNLEVVGEARDGIEAVEQARRLVPDVILMDYSLPGMNGVEAAHAIRRELPEVQVIALSMHREKERAEAMTAAGAVAYFNKSDDSDALIEAIAKYGSRSNRT